MPANDAAVSFARDIKPLFRSIDVLHMKPSGHLLAEYTYMSDQKTNMRMLAAFMNL